MSNAADATAPPPARPPTGAHIGLWVVQLILAVAFGGAGWIKLARPLAAMAEKMPWTTAVPPALVRFIGGCELLGAVGLLLPAATRILPRLTPLAACGLLAIQLLAIAFHISRGELQVLSANLMLAGLLVFVIWGRLKEAPIPPRG